MKLAEMTSSAKAGNSKEYALILVLVAVVVIAALTLMGPLINNIFSTINNGLVGTPPAP